ncbi:putative SnoaL-like aldol condensation-catalyzing enzyme [Lipingzhangella halophila]|uniref:Putative SnoaL-like aldol condensation-catalyzing enzyme n=1 Tax=Lipingzhangella halophila TaxID=1783352 RepID=A0A7W7RJ76_9ACTN|nr:nuclear transport factor 2 family protein [Lipingzhangella halophila]MBB4932979.1 putative SnoaL-like aldol condensation-catalyzing enzyme [Lipingzhangella halophila]
MTETPHQAPTQAERNRQRALHAFAEFANGDIEVLRSLLADDFVEHSPGNPSGRDAFMEFIATSPVAGATLDLKRVVADDEYVVMHYLMLVPGDDRGTAVADIWRFDGERIVEHWDVVQPVPAPEEIPNGMV